MESVAAHRHRYKAGRHNMTGAHYKPSYRYQRDRGKASTHLQSHCLLFQPIVQYGPFVMNTEAEIQQAMLDYQTGSNGFEHAKGWYSEIGLPITHADKRRR